jgi:hypothetical protein
VVVQSFSVQGSAAFRKDIRSCRRQARSEEIIQRVRRNPASYFKGKLSLVQKDVNLEDHITEPPLESGSLSSSKAWIEQILRESKNLSGGNQPAKGNSETAV